MELQSSHADSMLRFLGRWAVRLFYLAGGLGGAALTAIVLFQRKLIYVPNVPGLEPGYFALPDYFNLEYEDAKLITSDRVKLHAWLVWKPNSRREKKDMPIVLFFQENAGNMSYRLPFVKQLAYSGDCAVLMLSYRGYGESAGSPSQAGLQADSQAALDWVLSRPDLNHSKIMLFGRSLGGAVAVQLAAANGSKIAGIALENTFTCIPDMAGSLMRPLGYFVGRGKVGNSLVFDKWDSESTIGKLGDMPTLLLSSGRDEMVPAWQMQSLYTARGAPGTEWHYFPEGRHLDLYESHRAEYWPILIGFVSRL